MKELPPPLVPPDADLRDFAYMPLDVVRLRDSDLAASVSGEEFRAAVLLWCASWHQIPAGSLPDDDIQLSHLAGFGRVVKEWKKVKSGALHKWTKCSDGRLYHKTVAEKVLDATKSRDVRLWKAECARIRKHNERHKTNLPQPEFDEWLSLQCRGGQGHNVTSDKGGVSQATDSDRHEDTDCGNGVSHAEVTRDIDTQKGREGKGRENLTKKLSVSDPPPPARRPSRTRAEYDALEAALREASGVVDSPNAPGKFSDLSEIIGLIDAGVSLEETILPVLRSKKPKAHMAFSWGFFVDAIRGAHHRRTSAGAGLTPPKAQNPPGKTYAIGYHDIEWTEDFLRERVAGWRERGTWFAENWGPPPDQNGRIKALCAELSIPLDRHSEPAQ
jgi:hypothetical protein